MKKGFTLIELIFTIVILAITTMAIPRIVAQTTELNALAIKEELVYNAKAFMSRISKAQWDSAYAADASCGGDTGCMRRILTVNPPADGAPEVRPGILMKLAGARSVPKLRLQKSSSVEGEFLWVVVVITISTTTTSSRPI